MNDILGLVWDFDGTMAETREKNLNVTKKIVSNVLGISIEEVKARYSFLANMDNYIKANEASSNWKELYKNNTDMEVVQIMNAGDIWTKYQLADNTHAKFFDGIEDVIDKLDDKMIKQAIVSQNSKASILRTLDGYSPLMSDVIGYEQLDEQKPHPFTLIAGIESFNPDFDPGYVLSIGDHDTDSHMAANVNKLGMPFVVVHYAAIWLGAKNGVDTWKYPPYKALSHPSELLKEIENFSPNYEMLENGVLKQL